MKELFKIKNGNCNVTLYSNGTRIVETIDPDDNQILLNQPLSLDINISNRCSNGCPYCYAGNTPTGKVADLKNMHYLDNVTGIEIAINIQFPLPDYFEEWLTKMKDQNIIVSGTINQLDFERDISLIDYMKTLHDKELIHGIGISYRSYNKDLYTKLKASLGHDIVIHTIIGVTPVEDIIHLLDNGFKILILGYKQKNRGIDYYSQININKWVSDINKIVNYPFNSVLAFDTAGLKQANMKAVLSDEEWDRSFQGDEGSISFYIDAVNNTFNIDSHTKNPAYNIEDLSLNEMFKIIKNGGKL